MEHWWETYAYGADRTPLFPYSAMAQSAVTELASFTHTEEYLLKGMSRGIYHTLEFWYLLRTEQLKPSTNPKGTITYSSFMFRRLFNALREPGERIDKIRTYFKTIAEGQTAGHFIVIAKDRIFKVNGLNDDGTIISAVQILPILQQIQSITEPIKVQLPVAILTCDNRTDWATVKYIFHIQLLYLLKIY